ncbi:exonuclease SbcCD subunit D [Chloroflexota bacterium]
MANHDKNRIRLVHTSDLHLGHDYSMHTSELDTHACQVLGTLVDGLIGLKADLLIIAGDLFDNNRLHSSVVELTVKELAKVSIPIIILPGNHDSLLPDSVYHRVDLSRLAPNIQLFTNPDGERFSFPELNLSIWGRAIDSYDGHFRPMAGIPPRSSERWQIAVAHGHYVGDAVGQIYGLQISREEIVRSCCDYVALGHWGLYNCICDDPVKAYYSGSAHINSNVAIIDLFNDGSIQVKSQPLPL